MRLLNERPLDKITVREIAAECGISRNTFYYHFEDMNGLARTVAAETALEPDLVKFVFTQVLQGGGSEVLERIPGIEQRADRVCLLAGKHSNVELRQMLRDALIGVWSKAFGVDLDALDQEGRIAVEFVLGGIMAIIAYRGDSGGGFELRDLYDFGLSRDAMRIMRHVPPVYEKLAANMREEI